MIHMILIHIQALQYTDNESDKNSHLNFNWCHFVQLDCWKMCIRCAFQVKCTLQLRVLQQYCLNSTSYLCINAHN